MKKLRLVSGLLLILGMCAGMLAGAYYGLKSLAVWSYYEIAPIAKKVPQGVLGTLDAANEPFEEMQKRRRDAYIREHQPKKPQKAPPAPPPIMEATSQDCP
jgi:hypothetical protein